MKRAFLFCCASFLLPGVFGWFNAQAQGASDSRLPAAASWMASPQSVPVGRPLPSSDAVYAMKGASANYQTFSSPHKHMSDEGTIANKGHERHPEIGLLYKEAPCSNCYELIGERTETTKTFVREGSVNGQQEKMVQTSTQPMHYKDASGNWRTIIAQLQPKAGKMGVYGIAAGSEVMEINSNGSGYSALGKDGAMVRFNHDLELIYVNAAGVETSLGKANWSKHTAGDQGVYIPDAWAGIDIEMMVLSGAIKTNFYVKAAMPSYASGKLMIRDNMELATGLALSSAGGSRVKGDIFIKDGEGNNKYGIGGALVFEQGMTSDPEVLDYVVGDNKKLDIELPGSYLNKPAASYPIVIDPLVSLATSVPVSGSSYNASWVAGSGCLYTNPANTPPNCTVTGIEFQFQFTTVSPMGMNYGAFSFYKGACRNPTAPTSSWTCPAFGSGTCTAAGGSVYDIFTSLSSCLPPPSCASVPLNIQMYFYQNWATTAACVSTWCYGSQPLIFTVFGKTVELSAASASPATICAGASSTLTASGTFGVGPYTYSWLPGPVTGSPATVTPAATTTYNLTITDACGITATGSTTVTVNTVSPITGTTHLCVGTTSTLSSASTGAATWSSSNPSVATITSPGGVLSAITPGTSTISYTLASTGCYTVTVVTVDPLPAAIGGTPTLCVGGTTSLSNSTAGGTWSSSAPGVASVNSTGIVSGAAVGTTTITYGSSSCYVTTVVTVDYMAPVTGTLSICKGATTVLADVVPGGTWSSANAAVASINSSGVVTGAGGGTATISYIVPSGCYALAVVTVVSVPSITGTPSMCLGSSATLTNSMTGGLWTSSNAGVAPVGVVTGVVSGVSVGTTLITYTEGTLGCTATIVAVVNPVPQPIEGAVSVCQESSTILTDATPGGSWISSSSAVATVEGGVVTGIADGMATITYQMPTGCFVTAPLQVNPLPAAIAGPAHVCLGFTVSLADADAGGVWSSGNSSIATIEASGVATGASAGNAAITYTLPTGCFITAPLAVMPLPVADYFVQKDICPGEDVTVALSFRGPDVVDYLWDFAGATIVTASSNHGGPYILNWSAIGVYTISMVAVSSAGCMSPPVIDTIKIHALPDARIADINYVSKSPTVCTGDSILMSAKTYLGMHKYEWFPGDFFRDQVGGSRVAGTINRSSYVTLVVTDPFGCKARDSVFIAAQPCCQIFIPTAFTPNGDGNNDNFTLNGLGHHKLHHFRVENRWGQTVFETLAQTNGWDGTYNGVPQDMGVYYYECTYDCEGKTVIVKGDLTLIR